MAAVVTVGKGKVYPLIESHVHSPAHQGFDSFPVVADGIFYILNFPAVAQIPEPAFQVLLFYRRDILGNMTVETVADIFSVGYIFYNPVFFPELLYLHTAEVFRRCSVDGIQMPVLFLELIDPLINIFQSLQGKFPVLCDGFLIVKLLQLVQRRNSKGCGG